jgi:ketosteroid isomerase-like protein
VDQHGELAVLSMNLVSYGRVGGQPESVLARWNSTEVYRRIGGQWRIVHSHWSRTQADVKPGT